MTEQIFLQQGHALTGHNYLNGSRVVAENRFRAMFGISNIVCSIIWHNVQHPHDGQPVHLLYALMLLKMYETEHIYHALTGVDEKTFRKWAWIYVEIIATQVDVVS